MSNTLSQVPQVTTMADADTFLINTGGKQRLVSKSDLQDGLTVTSQQVLAGFIDETTTARSPTTSDVFYLTSCQNGSATTITLNSEASAGWSSGDILYYFQEGAGAITIAGASGVTVTGVATSTTQYQSMAAIYKGNDVWLVIGVV